MKKWLSIAFAVLLTICMNVTLTGCSFRAYCNPKGKEWYNVVSLPNISDPFKELYDGSYYIQVDKAGNTTFKPLNGEEMKGTLSAPRDDKKYWGNVSITFENGESASGRSYKIDSARFLEINYNFQSYRFTEKQQLSKEEFFEYRSQFISFLTNIYETGVFPSEEEIAGNSLYQQFTNYYQIDPGCGGPIVYDTVEKVTIEKLEPLDYGYNITINRNGTSIHCDADEKLITAIIKNKEIKESSPNDKMEGDCLVNLHTHWNGHEGIEQYSISQIFYIENS